jgi:hypothetical protein
MTPVYFLVGFIYNIGMLLICIVPMSIDCGRMCMKKRRFPWQFDPREFVDELQIESEN